METIVGLDVGYSGPKLAWGPSNNSAPARVLTLPPGAAPAEHYAPSVIDRGEEGLRVNVDGRDWIAGVEPERVANPVRDIHEEFPRTDRYLALVKAALMTTGASEIRALVTGLPVAQFHRGSLGPDLKERLGGSLALTSNHEVTVKDVRVAPQPIGTFIALATEHRDDPDLITAMEEGRLVVVDPGHYSMDWSVLDAGSVRSDLAGSSLQATSVLIEEAADRISRDLDGHVSPERIETRLRRGQTEILHGGQRLAIAGYLDEAAQSVAGRAATELRQRLRTASDQDPDVVALTGGGAPFFQEAIRAIFPGARLVVPPAPITANVRGYWYFWRFAR